MKILKKIIILGIFFLPIVRVNAQAMPLDTSAKPDIKIISAEPTYKTQVIGGVTYTAVSLSTVIRNDGSSNAGNFRIKISTPPTYEYANGYLSDQVFSYLFSTSTMLMDKDYKVILGGYLLPYGTSLHTTFTITVDVTNTVDESNENNNIFVKTVGEGKPDLLITDIRQTNGKWRVYYKNDSNLTISKTDMNNVSLDFQLGLGNFADRDFIATKKVELLEDFLPYEENYLEFDSDYLDKDVYASATIDSGTVIDESDENNNIIQRFITSQSLNSTISEADALTIKGKLVDEFTLTPISGAKLSSTYPFNPEVVTTDSNGNFSFIVNANFSKQALGTQLSSTWGLYSGCYGWTFFTLEKNYENKQSLEKPILDLALRVSQFDDKEIVYDAAGKKIIDVGNVAMYPHASLSVKSDVNASYIVRYKYKHLSGYDSSESEGSKQKNYYFTNALPGGYDVSLIANDESGKSIESAIYNVPLNSACNTVSVEYVSGKFKWTLTNDLQAKEIMDVAKYLIDGRIDMILKVTGQIRNLSKEQEVKTKYLDAMMKTQKPSEKIQTALKYFITYGVDANTVKLGVGERAAVVSSYQVAFAKLPDNEDGLADIIRIANGRWPNFKSAQAEKWAKSQFQKIYKKIPDMDDAKDNAAVTVMAYGLRQKAENRNLSSESRGILTFKNIFRKGPSVTADWNVLQAITYSGASRGVDTDGDLLIDTRENKLGTDPRNKDTDGDGYLDGIEVVNGYNPLRK